MRHSREKELLQMLSLRREGFTWRQLLGKHRYYVSEISMFLKCNIVIDGPIERWESDWPRKTLDRLLKALIQKGFVEKVMEPMKEGVRGRPCVSYRIPPKLWNSWGCLSVRWPARKVDSTFFFGQWRRRAYAYRDKKYVRLFTDERKRAGRV